METKEAVGMSLGVNYGLVNCAAKFLHVHELAPVPLFYS